MRKIFLLPLVLLGCSSSVDPAGETSTEDAGSTPGTDGAVVTDSGGADSGGPALDTGVANDSGTPTDAPSGGCGKAATAGVTNGSITVGGTDRTYVLSIPTGYDPSKPLPLVFAWHGRTGNGTLFRSYSGVERAAAGKAIVVYPNGLSVSADPRDTGWVLTSAGRDVALFDALVTEISSKLCVDSSRIMSFGHSYGGYMSNSLGCYRSNVLRGIGVVASGGPYGACGSALPVWITHAEDDATVNFSEGVKTRDAWVQKNGCAATTKPVTPDPCVAYDGCTKPVHWCGSKTGGHAYPPYAGSAIWSFFASL